MEKPPEVVSNLQAEQCEIFHCWVKRIQNPHSKNIPNSIQTKCIRWILSWLRILDLLEEGNNDISQQAETHTQIPQTHIFFFSDSSLHKICHPSISFCFHTFYSFQFENFSEEQVLSSCRISHLVFPFFFFFFSLLKNINKLTFLPP
ncbi:hypothetical protein ACP275_12G068600 [Erythranthe tilingii]